MLTRRTRREIIQLMKRDEATQLRLTAEDKAKMDTLRKLEPDLPSRSELIRRLVDRAYEAATKRGKK